MRIFENPAVIIVIIVVVLLLFAAPKLPGMARSLGQSMRILRSEVKEMKKDGQDASSSGSAEKPADEQPVEGKVIPPKGAEGDGGAAGPSQRA
ncbi:Sec-independent protein translocase subunit TatA [Sinomonas sp. ASV322]|uniref:Sec-independent protein translocase subunit TatA n=1 Tax=Sinomonas sp. ASV322 TaxID=3041920 RepID=UPI0027DE8579|nr:Sec-independent protein translocase subunit TatA [Sinomonas sp. ASV322]MDQ4501032.1 Sec-independent protein translocase subunit TatA [Sinomonas sp. ASV322]